MKNRPFYMIKSALLLAAAMTSAQVFAVCDNSDDDWRQSFKAVTSTGEEVFLSDPGYQNDSNITDFTKAVEAVLCQTVRYPDSQEPTEEKQQKLSQNFYEFSQIHPVTLSYRSMMNLGPSRLTIGYEEEETRFEFARNEINANMGHQIAALFDESTRYASESHSQEDLGSVMYLYDSSCATAQTVFKGNPTLRREICRAPYFEP